jgi:hypoxanthine phosphoribosyltransferase
LPDNPIEVITIKDKQFESFIRAEEIAKEIESLANRLSVDYNGKEVLFIAVLNGAFIFAADLFKEINIPCSISFVKVSSYVGTSSTGEVKQVIGLQEQIKGKHIVVIEDIVDSGLTIQKVSELLTHEDPASIEVCTLLFKPDAFQGTKSPKYIGFSIPNKFVVGYGLDYDGYGRNLKEICQLKVGE